MQGKVLVVDNIATNRIVIKVKLKKAFYDVLQADTLAEALRLIDAEAPDLVIAATHLPDGGAAQLCLALRDTPVSENIPVLAMGDTHDPDARLTALQAGAHDVLYQPVNETLLLGRVRSLIRASNARAEWQMREDTCKALGLAEDTAEFSEQGHCVLVGADRETLQSLASALRPTLRTKLSIVQASNMMHQLATAKTPDVFVLVLSTDHNDAMQELSAVSALRASAKTRHAGVIVIQMTQDPTIGATALDLGADDLMSDGIDIAELTLRARAVMRRQKLSARLRASVRTSLQAAVFDPLTGVYNRRYAMPHLDRVATHACATARPFAVLVLDLDHFKRINDVYGHAAGDAVLIEAAHRLRDALRPADMVARIGGEEFMVVMPNTAAAEAQRIATRICQDISSSAFTVPEAVGGVSVTISIGMAVGGTDINVQDDIDALGQAVLAEADKALYASKGHGRNQVTLGRPAA